MARLRRRRETGRQGTWRQALLFNSLLLLLIVLGTRVMTNAYTAESAGDVPDIQARNETRREIESAFQTIVPKGNVARAFWADQISRELDARDFSAARGYLLAAPVMLERDDARAILAAADAEESGSQDQRLVKAGLLFLPNETRAEYQRAIEPPRIEVVPRPDLEAREELREGEHPGNVPEPSDDTDAAGTASPEAASEGGIQPLSPDTMLATEDYEEPGGPAFSMVGDRTDLVRRAQHWVNGDRIDSLQLRLSAISLIGATEPAGISPYAEAISVLKAADRAGRLTPDYREYLFERVDLALPEETAFAAVRDALSKVAPMAELEERVLEAFRNAISAEGLARLQRDLSAVARIADLTSPSGAVTLLETARSPEDVKKLQLISEAGGDRAVALTKQIGPRVLKLAQIGVKWSLNLVLQLMALAAIAMALIWTAVSAVGQARPVRHYRH
ncbi:hypothetical protein [Henriciella aquimarina]|uniref:hypothetical protein n=1 Tax=Henriciella aquimarina TaxID=545261 RepID=UPI000A012BFA|nr:hypothetical protein [Henriciella aquimarina]